MESLNSPTAPAIPLVLRGEFDRDVGDQLTQEAMLAAAKAAGIEASAPVAPLPGASSDQRARRSAPGLSRVCSMRRRSRSSGAQIGLDPEALSPIMFVAGAGS